MQCSSLNADLYRKNIVERPSCQCGSFESAYHFFFACPRFTAERRRYLPETLSHYSVRELLSGKDNGTEQDNETLFLHVQDYIVKLGRFVYRLFVMSQQHQVSGKISSISGSMVSSNFSPFLIFFLLFSSSPHGKLL